MAGYSMRVIDLSGRDGLMSYVARRCRTILPGSPLVLLSPVTAL